MAIRGNAASISSIYERCFIFACPEKKKMLFYFPMTFHKSNVVCHAVKYGTPVSPSPPRLQHMVKGRTQTHWLVAWRLATWSNEKHFQTPVSFLNIQNYCFGVTQYNIRHHTANPFWFIIQHKIERKGDTPRSSDSATQYKRSSAGSGDPVLYMAYLWVQVLAVFSYLCRSVLYMCAISGTRGSSGFGSVSREQMDSNTLDIVSAGLHWSLRMSRQMLPLLLMFGWNTLVRNATCTVHSIDQGHMLWNRGLWILKLHGYSAWCMNSWTWKFSSLHMNG